jgi:hypothetical protein
MLLVCQGSAEQNPAIKKDFVTKEIRYNISLINHEISWSATPQGNSGEVISCLPQSVFIPCIACVQQFQPCLCLPSPAIFSCFCAYILLYDRF